MSEQPSNTISPINQQVQQQVSDLTLTYIHQANNHFNLKLPAIPVLFDLIGRTAGMFLIRNRKACIRFNPWLFAKYPDENINSTVPHEVAHYIVWSIYGDKRIKPHGNEWQTVMALFEADDSVTCNFDLTGIPQRKQSRFRYLCTCDEFWLSTTLHNRITHKRKKYICQKCSKDLIYRPLIVNEIPAEEGTEDLHEEACVEDGDQLNLF